MTELDEVFFANGKVEEDGDPIIWKTVLSSGRLELTPGPGGKKVKKPLIIVDGHSSNPSEEIGLQDLLDSFEEGAIQHVTIPTSHSNTVLENTGFIRGMRIVDEDGQRVLKAGFEFKDPSVHEKVKQGTIANVSCGILKGYERQRDGKKFNAVVDHIALTNKPWVDGMTPFSQFAEEVEAEGFHFAEQIDLARYNQSPNAPYDYTAHGVEEMNPTDTTGVKWDASMSMLARRHLVEEAIENQFPGCDLIDFTTSKVLVESEDDNEMYVTGYTVDDNGEVQIHPREEWLEYKPVGLSEDQNKMEGGKDPMDEVLLAEKEALQAELETARAEIAAQNLRLESAANAERVTGVENRIRELGALGLSEYPGFLAVVEEIMLADMGVVSVMLSEDGKEEGATTTQVVERLIAALPKKDENIVLSEQAKLLEGGDPKPVDEEVKLSDSERAAVAAEWLGLNDKKTVLA